jgi:hypothetical protein
VAAARPDGGPSPKRQLVIGDFQPFTGNLRVERDCFQTVARDAFSPDASIFETHVPSGRVTR